jgi:ankyrin repeat protein
LRSDNNYAFRIACRNCHIETAKLLLKSGLNKDDIRFEFINILNELAIFGNCKMFKFLYEIYEKYNFTGFIPKSRWYNINIYLKSKGYSINFEDIYLS